MSFTIRPPILEHCGVCGCQEVLLDEVACPSDATQSGAALVLGECPRCDYRWTATRAEAAPARAVVGPRRLASAA